LTLVILILKGKTMKKIFAILALASGTAFAADYISVDVDNVIGANGGANSTAQYLRAGKDIGSYSIGLQSRTARVNSGSDDGLIINSFETTVANKNVGIAGITPFVGVGRDNGYNGGAGYNYGLVGATTGAKVGPGFALVGVKARVGSTETNMTQQTVVFGTYSIPVAKKVSLNLNASRSDRSIQENAFGLGVGFSF